MINANWYSLQNVLGNAVKFTKNGSIKIYTHFSVVDESVIVTTEIANTGIGITPAAIDSVFQPFVQADASTTRLYGDTGLGLSIAQKYARLMGESIKMSSEPGCGTRVEISLCLPMAQPSSHRGPAGSKIQRNSSDLQRRDDIFRKDVHILLVEDNKVIQKVVLTFLHKLGFVQAICANNGVEAVDYIRKALESNDKAKTPLPDVILMDCQMPLLNGYDATKQLRSQYRFHGPIIALTASAIKGDRAKCIDAGMVSVLPNPHCKY